REELDAIHEELGLHPIAVEDALQSRDRPKLSRYAGHLFLSGAAVDLDPKSGQLKGLGISAFIVSNSPQTVTAHDVPIDDVVRRWDSETDLIRHGVAALVYGLLDYVVDSHLAAAQALDDQLEALEDLLFEDRPADWEMQRRTFELRKSLVRLR